MTVRMGFAGEAEPGLARKAEQGDSKRPAHSDDETGPCYSTKTNPLLKPTVFIGSLPVLSERSLSERCRTTGS